MWRINRRSDIPGGIEYIDYSVFGGCTGLNGTLTLSEGVKNVEQNAFAGCQIQRIVLPDSLESITPTTFSQCDHVKEIVWNGTKKFDGYSYLPAIEEGTSEMITMNWKVMNMKKENIYPVWKYMK